jgi:hypothetical protein
MNTIKITYADLCMELEQCKAMLKFLSISISHVLEQDGNFTNSEVPFGASECIETVASRLDQLITQI